MKNIDVMKITKLITWTIILFLLFMPFLKYAHAKTLWKDTTDCMVIYINNYYPYWEEYLIDWKYPHIDKRWLNYLESVWEIKGCIMNNSVLSFIINTPYCYVTLFFEKVVL